MQNPGRTYSRRRLESSQSLSQVLVNRTPPLQSSRINHSFRPGRPNTLFERQLIVRSQSNRISHPSPSDVFDQQSKILSGRQTGTGLIRKSVCGRQNVRNTADQRLRASARASSLNCSPLYRSIAARLNAHGLVSRTIFPTDIDTELYLESHTESYTESYTESTDMEHTGAESWLDNSTAA
jgi:hypothetical protein